LIARHCLLDPRIAAHPAVGADEALSPAWIGRKPRVAGQRSEILRAARSSIDVSSAASRTEAASPHTRRALVRLPGMQRPELTKRALRFPAARIRVPSSSRAGQRAVMSVPGGGGPDLEPAIDGRRRIAHRLRGASIPAAASQRDLTVWTLCSPVKGKVRTLPPRQSAHAGSAAVPSPTPLALERHPGRVRRLDP
jgi:hypothetical protein